MLEVPQKVSTEDRWQIERDCQTLIQAREVIEDEDRLKAAQAYFEEQKNAMEELSKDEYWKKIGIRK